VLIDVFGIRDASSDYISDDYISEAMHEFEWGGGAGIGGSNVALRASSCVDVGFGNGPIIKALCKLQSKRPMNFQYP